MMVGMGAKEWRARWQAIVLKLLGRETKSEGVTTSADGEVGRPDLRMIEMVRMGFGFD